MPPKTSFGYVEREADSYVNWADVGRTITNTVDEIDRVRTEKKAAIDAAYKEELERINNKPIGQKDDVTKWTIDLAYNAAENTKIQYNLLKSGKLAVKDFAIYLQNTNDSVKNLYGTVEKIQTAFKERLDRQANRENQKIEMWDGEDLEKYGKLTDLGANFNINGNLTFSRLETVTEDGKTITRAKPGSENLLSVNQLAGAVNSKYNYYNYLKDADEFITRLGDNLMSYRVLGSEDRAGSITQIVDKTGELDEAKAAALGITDATELARLKGVVSEYAKAEEAYINAALNPKYNKSSILTEELGYTPTDDAKEAAKKGSKLMLVQRETDGTITPILNETQEKEAREFLRGQYRQMIDKKLQIDTYTEVGKQKQEPRATTPAEFDWIRNQQKVKDISTLLGEIYYGTPEERDSAMKDIFSQPNVKDAYFDDDGNFVVETKATEDNPSKVIKVPFSDDYDTKDKKQKGKEYGAKNAVGALVVAITGGQISREEAKKLVPDKPLNRDYSKLSLRTKKAKEKPAPWEPIFSKMTAKDAVNIGAVKQKSAAQALNNMLAGTGLTAAATGLTGNYITLYGKDGKPLLNSKGEEEEIQVNWGEAAEANAANDEIKNRIQAYYTKLSETEAEEAKRGAKDSGGNPRGG